MNEGEPDSGPRRHALITGGAGGLGSALAMRFLRAGHRVTVIDRNQAALDKLIGTTPPLEARCIDVTDVGALSDLAAQMGPDPAGPDILVNNAGLHIARALSDPDYSIDAQLADIHREIQVNFTALAQNCAIWRPYLQQRPGKPAIVNTASALSFVPKMSSATYCATKAAVDQFTRVLRLQLATTNVRVVTVYPPLVHTPLTGERASGAPMSPDRYADLFYRAFVAGKDIIRIGQVRWLYYLERLLPAAARHFIK